MSERLRVILEDITHDGTPVETHPAKLEALSLVVPHSIRVQPTPHAEPLGDFNCVMHALDLTARLETPNRLSGYFYADTVFLGSLIQRAILRPCAETEGAIVVWSVAGAIKHVGIVVAYGRASSKWGIGYVYEHGLLEVPKGYGDALAFYGPLESEVALNHLTQYWAR